MAKLKPLSNILSTSQSFPTFLTPTQTAKILNISVSTLRGLIQARKIPFYKIGGSIRFSEEELKEYIAAARIKAMKEYF